MIERYTVPGRQFTKVMMLPEYLITYALYRHYIERFNQPDATNIEEVVNSNTWNGVYNFKKIYEKYNDIEAIAWAYKVCNRVFSLPQYHAYRDIQNIAHQYHNVNLINYALD